MKALRFATFGDPLTVLRLEEMDMPTPGPGEVRLRMTHRPINPSDLYCVQGRYPVRPALPGSPGFEGIGVIDALGDGVSGFAPGQRVVTASGAPGTWAESLIAPAGGLIPIPDAITNQAGAQLVANPMSAWALLTSVLTLSPGDWILQTAAASTLGHLIIQLARHRGIRTINVVRRPDHVRALQDARADATICTRDEHLIDRVRDITDGKGVLAAIDAVGGPESADLAACLGAGGTLLSIGLLSGAPLGPLDAAPMIFTGTTVRGFWLLSWMQSRTAEERHVAFGAVIALLAAGTLTPPVEAEYDLANYLAAIEHAHRSGRRGKVLLFS